MFKPMSDHCNGCPFWGKIDCSNICILQEVPGTYRRVNKVYGEDPIEDIKVYADRAEYYKPELDAIHLYENRLKDMIFQNLETSSNVGEYSAYLKMIKMIERTAYETEKEYTG